MTSSVPPSRPPLNRPPTLPPPTRREFFRDAARYTVLAALGALGAEVVARGGPLVGRLCPGAGACGGCFFQPRCPAPSAAAARPRPAAQTSPP